MNKIKQFFHGDPYWKSSMLMMLIIPSIFKILDLISGIPLSAYLKTEHIAVFIGGIILSVFFIILISWLIKKSTQEETSSQEEKEIRDSIRLVRLKTFCLYPTLYHLFGDIIIGPIFTKYSNLNFQNAFIMVGTTIIMMTILYNIVKRQNWFYA